VHGGGAAPSAGTAGRIENGQVAVYLTYARTRGHAMIDRELYLPRSWTEEPQRYVEPAFRTTSSY
jgi:SRSO17 transposase